VNRPSAAGERPRTGPAPGHDPLRWRHLGFRLILDPSVRLVGGPRPAGGPVTLLGGHPGRLLRLTRAGTAALGRLTARPPLDDAEASLAERLVAGGLAHPRPAVHPHEEGRPDEEGPPHPAVTVVVPTRGRPDLLAGCLASLGDAAPVVVVDDGSADHRAIAATCRAHGARLVVRAEPGGPGAARNDGVAHIGTELVAFVDSDCIVTPGWLEGLTWLFADPCVGAVAPRVQPAPTGTTGTVARFAASRSPLDLGGREGRVGPAERVRYVPTAALVVRATAFGDGFDAALHVGEDVDLVWRLVAAGWDVRYVPSVTVHHREPSSPWALLRRRVRYGTSAAPLARRHRGHLPLTEVAPLPAATVVATLAGRPGLAAAAQVVSLARALGRARTLGLGPELAARWSLATTAWTAVGLSRAATVGAGPLVLAAATLGRRSRRAAAIALLALPPLVEWWQGRPALGPLRWTVLAVADDLAYGIGVWCGCLRWRTVAPLVPAVRAPSRP
jgi:mycofactocin system glycosyltransferase